MQANNTATDTKKIEYHIDCEDRDVALSSSEEGQEYTVDYSAAFALHCLEQYCEEERELGHLKA